MEDLLELLVVLLIFIFGTVKKSKKKQKKKASVKPKAKTKTVWQSAMAQTAPVQPAEPVVMPLESLAETRQDFESAVAALSDLLDLAEKPSAAVKPSGGLTREMTSIETETALKNQAVKANSGESIVDAHGCIGGSMPEHTAEGETLAEHAVHEHNRTERLEAESAAVRTEQLRKPNLTELRRAVVMSEILDKPVSLRRRSI